MSKSKKESVKSLMRFWGLPESMDASDLRYRNPVMKGIYWYYFSRMRRKQDFEKYGTCITCDLPIDDWTMCDAGHIIAAARCGVYLQMHPLNVHLQHKKCNNPRMTPDAGFRNAINLDKRYGKGTAEKLHKMRLIVQREYSSGYYETRTIAALRELGLSTVPALQEISPGKDRGTIV